MGVTIHYRLGQEEKYVKPTLDAAYAAAKEIAEEQASRLGIHMEMFRESDAELIINIGGCESIYFNFRPVADIEKTEGWDYAKATLLEDNGLANQDRDLWWSSAFTKTQYADQLIEHKWVADIIRIVASRCHYAEVGDEGDYYHSGNMNDAAEAIGANGELIASLGKALRGEFGDDNVISGGETKVGKNRKKK